MGPSPAWSIEPGKPQATEPKTMEQKMADRKMELPALCWA
jgi:hypothetical protein